MDRQFDELSKSLAEGLSRRDALRKFGLGVAGVLLAAVGLQGRAWAGVNCTSNADCKSFDYCCGGTCINKDCTCFCSTPCPAGTSCKKVIIGGSGPYKKTCEYRCV